MYYQLKAIIYSIYLAIILLSQARNEVGLNSFKLHDSTFCKNKSGNDFIQCIEEGAFMTKDIILDKDNINITPIYLSDNVGLLSHILQIDPGVITKDSMNSFKLKLDSCIRYQMSILGHNIQFLFASPTIPRSFLKPPPGPGVYAFYMKVKLVKLSSFHFIIILFRGSVMSY